MATEPRFSKLERTVDPRKHERPHYSESHIAQSSGCNACFGYTLLTDEAIRRKKVLPLEPSDVLETPIDGR
jgi:hypothetical protein